MKNSQDRPLAHLSLLFTGLIVRLMLRTLGFKRTFNLITSTRTTSQTRTIIPLQSKLPYLTCLEDSLAKAREIRKDGLGATLYIGVMGSKDYKFHAWIQQEKGKDINLKFVKMKPQDTKPSTSKRTLQE